VDASPVGDDIAITMNIPDAPGLHNLLSRSASLEDAVRRDPNSSLHLISGGSETGQIQAIDSSNLAQLVEALETAYDKIVFYCGPAEAKSLITQPCQTEPWLVLVADMTSTQDNIMWLADAILAGLHAQPAVAILKANIITGWSLPQLPGWKRAAA
jgi:MinD-like ATPase involved in chromosome partitioning or flagellar assembly